MQRGSDIANFLVTYLDPVLFSTLYYLVVHGDDTDLEIALALVVDEMKNATKDGTTLDIQRVVDEGTIWWGLRVLLDQFGGEFRLGRHVGYKGIAEVCSNLMNGNRRSVICPSVEEATTEATPEIHVEEKTRLRVIQNCAEIAQALESEGGQDLVAKKLWAFSAIQLDCLAGSDVLEEHMYFVGLTLEVLGRLCPDETPSHDQRGRPHARLILFVHGFWGSAEGTWGSFRQLIGDDEALADCDVAFHDYPTSPGKGGLPISVLADGLRTELNNRYAEYNDVVLVCHSLGGLVAKHYLIDEVTREAPLRVTSLVNYAVPHQGVHLASLASMLPGIGKLVAQLARDSDVLQHLQRGWATAPKLEDIVLRDVVASDDRVVERASSQGTPGKADVVLGAGHKSVVKPSRKEDMAFLILRSELLRSQHSAPGR
ncbi:MAG: alpha/beta fold hydrolase [Planctomycetota bacterium]